MISWLIYFAVMFGLFSTGHYILLVIIGVVGFGFCLGLTLDSVGDNSKAAPVLEKVLDKTIDFAESPRKSKPRKQTRRTYNYNENYNDNLDDDKEERNRREYEEEQEERERQRREEKEREELERQAAFYRSNDGEDWRINGLDDQLGRSQRERDYEDDKYRR